MRGTGVLRKPRQEDLSQLLPVGDLLFQFGKLRPSREVLAQLKGGGDITQRVLFERADHAHRAVRRGEHPGQWHGRPVDLVAAVELHARFLHLHMQHRVVHGHLDLLPLTGALPGQQRQQDALK